MRRAKVLATLILGVLLTTSVFAGVVEDAEEALRRVRLIDAQYVQSEAQEALLYEFENALLQKMA